MSLFNTETHSRYISICSLTTDPKNVKDRFFYAEKRKKEVERRMGVVAGRGRHNHELLTR